MKYSPAILAALLGQLVDLPVELDDNERALLSGRPQRECICDGDLCESCRHWINRIDDEIRPILIEVVNLLRDYLHLRVIGFTSQVSDRDDLVNELLNAVWEHDWLANLPKDGDPLRRRVAALRLERTIDHDND